MAAGTARHSYNHLFLKYLIVGTGLAMYKHRCDTEWRFALEIAHRNSTQMTAEAVKLLIF